MAVYVLVALSFQVVLRSGVFSFASIGFYGLGSYFAGNLADHHLSTPLVLIATGLAVWVAGYALALVFGQLRGLYLGMVTFAFDQIIVVVGTNGGSLTGNVTGLYGVPMLLSTGEVLLLALFACLLVSQLERGALGRALAILRVDERLGNSQGFAVRRQRNFVFALSATLGGIAGAASILTTGNMAPSNFDFSLLVLGLTMAVVGGVTSWTGAALGAVVITWFPDLAERIASYQAAIYSFLIVLVVVYEPDGLVGFIRTLKRKILSRSRSSSDAIAGANSNSQSEP